MVTSTNRALTERERELAEWMLRHGTAEALDYLDQLRRAQATPWKCQCGCATPAPPGVHVLGDFIFGAEGAESGAFIYSCEGVLSGLEVYGLAGEAPKQLPKPEELRSWGA
ncbi:MAG: hypothetical protein DMG13_16970 [Acidobacteria bacterium]|nr:MAG: hypothetical protein DMG13_16970 [Acidobacteriota bacterium]